MKKDKINLILSWVLFVVAIYLIPIYDLISLLILIIIPRFRKIENEKILGREFLEENIDATKMAKLVSFIIALVVLIYTLYKVLTITGSSADLPGIWTIMFILSPVFIMLVKYEIYLFKHYTENT